MLRALRNHSLRLFRWIGSHELAVLLAFAGAAAGGAAFLIIASEVSEGETLTLDRKLLLAMRGPGLTPVGSPQIQEIMRDCTALGGITVLTLLTLGTAGFLLLTGKGHMALFVCCSVASGMLAGLALKGFYQRPRPSLIPHEAALFTTSFPSGHSMMSALTYLTLGALLARSYGGRSLKAYFLCLAVLLSGLTGVSRVYLAVHWPTDVLAGWTAGASWAALCWLVARRLQARHAIEGPA